MGPIRSTKGQLAFVAHRVAVRSLLRLRLSAVLPRSLDNARRALSLSIQSPPVLFPIYCPAIRIGLLRIAFCALCGVGAAKITTGPFYLENILLVCLLVRHGRSFVRKEHCKELISREQERVW